MQFSTLKKATFPFFLVKTNKSTIINIEKHEHEKWRHETWKHENMKHEKNSHIKISFQWHFKGGYISGFTMAPDELPVWDDVFTSAFQSGCQKANYIVQFPWRNLTSGYKFIGPCFPISSSVDSNIPQEFFPLSLKVFSKYGFIISIVFCDGASSNLTLLKLLCRSPRASLPANEDVDDLKARYFAKTSFVNPKDPSANSICPSYQVLFIMMFSKKIIVSILINFILIPLLFVSSLKIR